MTAANKGQYAKLQAAIASAKGLINNRRATPAQLQAAINTLHNISLAIKQLDTAAAKSAKDALVKQLGWSSQYDQATISNANAIQLQNQIKQAKAILANGNATAAQVDAIRNNLHNLGAAIVKAAPAVAAANLRQQLKWSMAYSADGIAADQYATLQTQIANANQLLASGNATAAQLTAIQTALHATGAQIKAAQATTPMTPAPFSSAAPVSLTAAASSAAAVLATAKSAQSTAATELAASKTTTTNAQNAKTAAQTALTNAQAALKNGQKPSNAKYADATNSQVKAVVSAQLGHLVRQYMNDYKTGASKAKLTTDFNSILVNLGNNLKLTYVGNSSDNNQIIKALPGYGATGGLFSLSAQQVFNVQQLFAGAINAIRDAAGISTITGHVQLNAQLLKMAETMVSPAYQNNTDVTKYLTQFTQSTGLNANTVIQNSDNDQADYGINNTKNRASDNNPLKEIKQSLLDTLFAGQLTVSNTIFQDPSQMLNDGYAMILKRVLGITGFQMDSQKANGAQTEFLGVSETYLGKTYTDNMGTETFQMVVVPNVASSFDDKSKFDTTYVATPTQSTSTTNNTGASTAQLQSAVNSAQAALNAAVTALANANATQTQKQTAYNNATSAVASAQAAYNKALAE